MATHDPRLGAPIGDELRIGEWIVRHYERGSICRHPHRGAWEIPNPFRDHWKNGLIEKLGFPKGELRDVTVADRPMRALDFDGGIILWEPALDVVFDVKEVSATVVLPRQAWGLYGRWDPMFEEGVVGIHAALLHTHEVLFWTYLDDHKSGDVTANGEWSLLSLRTGKVILRETTERNQFCSGQCLLGDGKVLAVGGDRKSPLNGSELNARTVQLFDPITRSWERLDDLDTGRWYPTVAPYGATTAIIVGGRDRTSSDESQHVSVPSVLFIAQSGLTGPQCDFDSGFAAREGDLGDTYPFVFVLPGGHLFVHLANRTRLPLLPNLNFVSARKATDPTGPRTYDRQGTAVLLPLRPPEYRARVMLIGGNSQDPRLAVNKCVMMDAGALLPSAIPVSPAWTPAKFLNNPRHMGDSILLPDGKVLLVNGVTQGQTTSANPKSARLEAELYDPAADQWVQLASMTTPRGYHATALLLPDGRVLSTGTDRTWNKDDGWHPDQNNKKGRPNCEVFSPPYLFWGPRPTIGLAPQNAGYGEVIEVATEEAQSIKSAVLIRNGSCTHSFNSDQRFIELEIVERLQPAIRTSWERVVGRIRSLVFTFRWPHMLNSRGLRLRTPPNDHVAPAGYYMLFLMSDRGVPSVARFIRLGKSRDPWFTVTRVERRLARSG